MEAIGVDDQPQDLAIASRARAGDEEAFALIVGRYHADLERVAFTVCGDPDIAREAAAAAWTKAWRGMDRMRDPARLRPWLVAISANEARQLMRTRRRRQVAEIRASELLPSAEALPDVTRLDLERALGRLDPDERTLLALRYVAGLTSAEIGSAIGLSANGVRTRLARLCARLREELRDG